VSQLAQAEIERILAEKIGLDAASIGTRAIGAAIATRMAALGMTQMAAYAEALLLRPGEMSALVEEVVVPETWFLRDRVPFSNLASFARARAATRKEVFRVLSVPCSTGEEAYSVGIAMLDAGFTPADFEIDAVDVSERVIAIAKRAVYAGASFRGDDLRFRDHHFAPAGAGFEVLRPLRERVRFRTGNLLELEVEPGRRYHAILCRNVLIYLTQEARGAVLERLEQLLEEGGALIVGHAEMLRGMEGRFRTADVPGSFTYYRTSERPKPGTLPPPTKPRLTPARGMKPPRPATSPAVLAPLPDAPPPERRNLLADAAALADRGELADAADLCLLHLKDASDDAAAHALLGTIRRAAGRLDEAEEHYSRALYCEPGHYESLVQLALLRERRGDRAGAENLRRRAAKARGGPR
jgi:chemotaxis protein methyltransferase WspC